MIRALLQIKDKLNYYGGAEEAPAIWKRFLDTRRRLFCEMQLPMSSEITGFVDMPYCDPTLTKEERSVSFSEIRKELHAQGITTTDSFQTFHWEREEHIEWLYDVLLNRAEEHSAFQPYNVTDLLVIAQEYRLPATDVLTLVGLDNTPYARFLINVVLYGDYGTIKEVKRELQLLKEPDIEFLLILHQSILLLERQQAERWLRNAGLRFIDQFLWWEKDISGNIHLKSIK